MRSNDPELERLKRIRDQQLAARDPQAKARKLHRNIAHRHREATHTFSLGMMWSQIPRKWKGLFYGLVLGVSLIVVLPMIWDSIWSIALALIASVFMTLLGFLIGRAYDAQDSLHDLTH